MSGSAVGVLDRRPNDPWPRLGEQHESENRHHPRVPTEAVGVLSHAARHWWQTTASDGQRKRLVAAIVFTVFLAKLS